MSSSSISIDPTVPSFLPEGGQGTAFDTARAAQPGVSSIPPVDLQVENYGEGEEEWDDEDEEDDDGPGWLSGDTVAFASSMFIHMGMVLALALIPMFEHREKRSVLLAPPAPELIPEQAIVAAEDVAYSDIPQNAIGALSSSSSEMAEAAAPELSDISEIPTPMEIEPRPMAKLDIKKVFDQAVAPLQAPLLRKGSVGEGVTGANGAVDRVTFEILNAMEERPTLVVWLFDESGSLIRQRQEILDRFDRIYEELGIVQEAQERRRPSSMKKDPLLTSIISFGQNIHLMTKEPTSDMNEIKNAVRAIEEDTTGVERVFSALYTAANEYKSMRRSVGQNGPARNVLLIVVSDERGDDQEGLEPTVDLCRKYGMPVYVIGVPAPFGREHTYVKYVDPDPKYDQTPSGLRSIRAPNRSCLNAYRSVTRQTSKKNRPLIAVLDRMP